MTAALLAALSWLPIVLSRAAVLFGLALLVAAWGEGVLA
jgi:hypothetical protein